MKDIPEVITACSALHLFILDKETEDDVVLEDGDLQVGAVDVTPSGTVSFHGEEKRTIVAKITKNIILSAREAEH